MVQVIIWVENKDSGSWGGGGGGMGTWVMGQRKPGVERVPREQRRNKAIALKETEADLRAPRL